MRYPVVLALAGACGGGSGGVPVGTVSVTVYSNGQPATDTTINPMPLAGVTVFEESGAVVTTAADGTATLPVTEDPATVHVAGTGLTTVMGVPVGGQVLLGNRPYLPSVGELGVTLQDIGAMTYAVAAPQPCVSFVPPRPAPQLSATYRANCANYVMRFYGEAFTATGTKIVEQDISISPNMPLTMGGYVDATSYAFTLATNAPSLPSTPVMTLGVVDPSTVLPIYLPTLEGPSDADFVRVVADDGAGASSQLLVQRELAAGSNTLDGSHLLPVPMVEHADAHSVSWSVGTSGVPNLVEVVVTTGGTSWTIFAPPAETHAAFPTLPTSVAALAPATGASVSGRLDVMELPTPALTLDALAGAWPGTAGAELAPSRVDHMPIATASQTF